MARHRIFQLLVLMILSRKIDEVTDEFYDYLDRTYSGFVHMKFITGNFNANIDKDENLKMFTGMHNLHKESSTNGIRLVDFAILSYMIICNMI